MFNVHCNLGQIVFDSLADNIILIAKFIVDTDAFSFVSYSL